MRDKSERLENAIEKHQEYWEASVEYVDALDELKRGNNLSDEDIQRLRCMMTKLVADRYQIEFELNRLVEKNQ